jgi:hypothetical protein
VNRRCQCQDCIRERSLTLRWFGRAVVVIAFVLWLVFIASCAKQSGEPDQFTGKTFTGAQVRADVPGATLGSLAYAEVNPAWLEWYYPKFRDDLSAGAYGITKWDGSFKCTAFTTLFVAEAQMTFFKQSFHSTVGAQSVALGEFWYMPAGSTVGHALVVALTPQGRRFFEPQTGKWVTLTQAEVNSAFLRKFN